MKPQSRAARIRAWLNTQDGPRLPREIIAGVQAAEREAGLPESRDVQIYWSVGLMFNDGILDREGASHYERRYWLIREPVVPIPLTVEQKRARSALRARERHRRNGGKTREQMHAEAVARKEARKAARMQRLAEQEARVRARRQDEIDARNKRQAEAAKKRAQAEALARAQELVRQMKAKQSAHRQPRKPIDQPPPRNDIPAPKPAPLLESSFEAEARGVKVERLPPGACSKQNALKHFAIAA